MKLGLTSDQKEAAEGLAAKIRAEKGMKAKEGAPSWAARMAKEDAFDVMKNGGSAVILTQNTSKTLKGLGIKGKTIDLHSAMVSQMKAEASRAGASWEVVAKAQADPSSPDKDKLALLQARARKQLFQQLQSEEGGVILTGVKKSGEWGVSEDDLTAYLYQKTARGLDRSNKNKFVLAISENPLRDRMIRSIETPKSWGGSISEAIKTETHALESAASMRDRLASEKKSQSRRQEKQSEQDRKKRDRAAILDKKLGKESREIRRGFLGGLTKESKASLLAVLGKNARSGTPTKKAIKSVISSLSLVSDEFREEKALGDILEWYKKTKAIG
jgi:hypothetical protein